MNMLHEPSEPPQLSQYGHIRLSRDTFPQHPTADVLGHGEVGYFRMVCDFKPLFFGYPKTEADVSFGSYSFAHFSSLQS
jgi:hypothetical protein